MKSILGTLLFLAMPTAVFAQSSSSSGGGSSGLGCLNGGAKNCICGEM